MITAHRVAGQQGEVHEPVQLLHHLREQAQQHRQPQQQQQQRFKR